MLDYDSLINALDGDDFDERPVAIEEFVTSPTYLNAGFDLSIYQYQLIKASTQIYKLETLIKLYGEEEGHKRYKQTCNEVIFQLGKGSGKDLSSTVACAYIIYLLLCLKDPATYYKKPPGDTIDILNIAINAAQANNVFFKNFVTRIERSPWFQGKYEKKNGHFSFDKNINLYSGHSEREAFEGYNVIYVVLDEISGFAIDSTSGNEKAKTASAVYEMYRASVSSRFPEFGKLVLLSFPRFKGDFIQQRYNDVIADKDVLIRSHTFKVNQELPDGYEGNEFTIEWEEDHNIMYRMPKIYALKRPTWEVNPTKSIDDFMRDFYDNPQDALGRFACMPPDAVDAFFKDRQKVEQAFVGRNGVDSSGVFHTNFLPDPEKKYFVHVDLARKVDHCAVALAHVDKWEQRRIGAIITEPAPTVIVDAVRWWTPTKDKNVDFAEVREYIVSLRKRGFNVELVTFDRWESHDMMQYLESLGMQAERLSVAKRHYEDFAMVMMEGRLLGPNIDLLINELLRLRIMPNDKIDHPRTGSKDLADAVCGAIYNAVSRTAREMDTTVEVKDLKSFQQPVTNEDVNRPGRIKKPDRGEMPQDISDLLTDYFRML